MSSRASPKHTPSCRYRGDKRGLETLRKNATPASRTRWPNSIKIASSHGKLEVNGSSELPRPYARQLSNLWTHLFARRWDLSSYRWFFTRFTLRPMNLLSVACYLPGKARNSRRLYNYGLEFAKLDADCELHMHLWSLKPEVRSLLEQICSLYFPAWSERACFIHEVSYRRSEPLFRPALHKLISTRPCKLTK